LWIAWSFRARLYAGFEENRESDQLGHTRQILAFGSEQSTYVRHHFPRGDASLCSCGDSLRSRVRADKGPEVMSFGNGLLLITCALLLGYLLYALLKAEEF
jgi:K+-transporting ATPase KdpF subunit